MMAITKKQISLIHVAKNRLGLSDEDYRDILTHVGGVESSKQLDRVGFDAVMDHLAKLGFRSEQRKKWFGERRNMATPQQVNLIRQLWSEYTDGEGDEASLGKWLDHTFKVSALRFLSRDLAPKAITALKSMKERKRAAHS